MFIGPYLTVAAVWTIADIFNGLMAIPNVIALIALRGVVAKDTTDYFKQFDTLSNSFKRSETTAFCVWKKNVKNDGLLCNKNKPSFDCLYNYLFFIASNNLIISAKPKKVIPLINVIIQLIKASEKENSST